MTFKSEVAKGYDLESPNDVFYLAQDLLNAPKDAKAGVTVQMITLGTGDFGIIESLYGIAKFFGKGQAFLEGAYGKLMREENARHLDALWINLVDAFCKEMTNYKAEAFLFFASEFGWEPPQTR